MVLKNEVKFKVMITLRKEEGESGLEEVVQDRIIHQINSKLMTLSDA